VEGGVILDDTKLRELIRETVREAVRDELRIRTDQERDGYLSVREAAEHASTSPWQIRYWVGQGKLSRFAVGRVLRVKRAELEALLREPQVTAEAPETSAIAAARRRRGA
jgi:excisionase family DNA binding protein